MQESAFKKLSRSECENTCANKNKYNFKIGALLILIHLGQFV
jgi:hypothetical protein